MCMFLSDLWGERSSVLERGEANEDVILYISVQQTIPDQYGREDEVFRTEQKQALSKQALALSKHSHIPRTRTFQAFALSKQALSKHSHSRQGLPLSKHSHSSSTRTLQTLALSKDSHFPSTRTLQALALSKHSHSPHLISFK